MRYNIDSPAAPMPDSQQRAAVSARVLDILQPRNQIRYTPQTQREACHRRPQTIMSSVPRQPRTYGGGIKPTV